MLRKLKTLSNRGDTIIEVMIVLAVLGLAMSISYATADRSLLNARQAQENSIATEVAQSQVEGLASIGCTSGDPSCDPNNIANPSYQLFHQTNPFCLDSSYNVVPWTNSTTPAAACENLSSLPANSNSEIKITCLGTCTGSPYTFSVQVQWDDVLEGTDTVKQDYVIPLSAAVVGGEGVSGISPSLAASGCTGPVGVGWSGHSCQSGDSIAVTVNGVNAGDTCVFKNDQGDNSGSTILTRTASGTGCSGSFTFSRLGLGNGQTGYLTAYVTDNGQPYTSNSVSFTAWPPPAIHYACSWPGADHAYGGVDYSNWYFTVNSDPCIPGTTCYTVNDACGTYAPTFSGYEEFDVACQYGSIYVYGSTWNGFNNTAIPCPPGTTQISRAILRAPPFGLQTQDTAQTAAYEGYKLQGDIHARKT